MLDITIDIVFSSSTAGAIQCYEIAALVIYGGRRFSHGLDDQPSGC